MVTVGGAQIAAGTRYDFPAVAPTPDGYLVVWRHFDGTLEGRFLTVAGAPSGAGFPVSTAETTDGPALAANGMSRALAVYARNDSSTRVRGRIIATVDNMDPVDAGPRVDASRPGDAAVPDAAAMSRDAGAPDAETRVTPDATRPDAGRSLDGGDDGGCTVARGGVCGGALTWLLVGAALCSRRRRGRSP